MVFDNGFGPGIKPIIKITPTPNAAVANASFTVLDSKGNPVTSAPAPEKKKTMLTGLPTAVVMYYAKASNTNVTLQQCISPSAPTGTKIRAYCNACHAEYKLNEQETWDFIDNPLMDSVANFASKHRHEEQGPPQKDPRIIPAKSAGSISISIAAESGERKFKDI